MYSDSQIITAACCNPLEIKSTMYSNMAVVKLQHMTTLAPELGQRAAHGTIQHGDVTMNDMTMLLAC